MSGKNFGNKSVLTESWYFAMSSKKLKQGKVTPFFLHANKIALFRGANGKVTALKSRCPHLGADLCQGTVEENSLQCPFHGWKFNGVYASDSDNVDQVTNGALGAIFKGGDPIWEDVNGDNIIDVNDRQIIGDATPDFFGGITNNFSYKNISLSVFFQFSYGNDIYSEINHQRNSVVRYNNLSTDALDRWREQGDVTDFPRPLPNKAIVFVALAAMSPAWPKFL